MVPSRSKSKGAAQKSKICFALKFCKMQRHDNDHFHLDKMNFSKNHLVVNCFNEFFMFYSSLPAEKNYVVQAFDRN